MNVQMVMINVHGNDIWVEKCSRKETFSGFRKSVFTLELLRVSWDAHMDACKWAEVKPIFTTLWSQITQISRDPKCTFLLSHILTIMLNDNQKYLGSHAIWTFFCLLIECNLDKQMSIAKHMGPVLTGLILRETCVEIDC